MTEPEDRYSRIKARIRAEFEGGFPLLVPVPSTYVIQLIDYANSLSTPEREDLVDDIAGGTQRLLEGGAADVIGRGGAYDRFYKLKMGPGPITGGARYTPVRFLADRRFPGVMPGATAPPRADLMPDLAALVPATASTLKPRVTQVMSAAGFALHRVPGGNMRFLSPTGTLVDFDFGARVDQLRVGVAIDSAALVQAPRVGGAAFLPPETFFGSYSDGWDYLTEENADRCLGHLPTLIAAAEDMQGLTC